MNRPTRRFWFKLARELGMSVRRAQREIDSREFAEWIAYDGIEPFGEDRGDLRAGIIAATIANANRGKNSSPFHPKDFMPDFERKHKQQTDEEMQAFMRSVTARLGGKIKGKAK